MGMIILGQSESEAELPMGDLIKAIAAAFAGDVTASARTVIDLPGASHRLMLVMPAFERDGLAVVKLATVTPQNPGRGLASIQGLVVAFSETGKSLMTLDGATVTRRRTAAASALASSYLSRPDSRRLVILGTGALVPALVEAHATVRPIRKVRIWGRNRDRVAASISAVEALGLPTISVAPLTELADSVGEADIVTCATMAETPILQGEWLRPGTFVDLVGSFSPDRREADDAVILRSRIYVDTHEGALSEAGDLLQPMNRGLIGRHHILGDLEALVSGRVTGRASASEITLFKSVGTSIEDWAAAKLVLSRLVLVGHTFPGNPPNG